MKLIKDFRQRMKVNKILTEYVKNIKKNIIRIRITITIIIKSNKYIKMVLKNCNNVE
jgi:hypothetical protein